MTGKANNEKKVDLARFATIVDAYGAEPAAWPEDEREGALALLRDSEQAVRLRDEAAALDEMLVLPNVEPSPALQQEILGAAPATAVKAPSREADTVSGWAQRLWPFGPGWQPAAALVAAAVAGLTIGLAIPDASPTEEPTVVADVALDMDDDWSEVP